ncbi:hypothetical protein BG011_001609 [Mortierella polycephala]|uniref:Uncharacterized protein n=1 Tax=Mortierella polycephala TaxID=41804 RepID=A0A9P6PKP8_9FUNG|nr:hypothetical protein BG011_001609 [Mortierella polycephala]
MPYPKLNTPSAFLAPMAGVHAFFYGYDSTSWTPSAFAKDRDTVSMSEFSSSLKVIDKAGRLAINKYARDILRYLASQAGKQMLLTADQELTLKLYEDQAARVKLKRRLVQEARFYEESIDNKAPLDSSEPSSQAPLKQQRTTYTKIILAPQKIKDDIFVGDLNLTQSFQHLQEQGTAAIVRGSGAVNSILDLSADWIPRHVRLELVFAFEKTLTARTLSDQEAKFCSNLSIEMRRSGKIKNRDEDRVTPMEIIAFDVFKAL